ncbi:MAG TPA: DUF4893 domain-containing protein [Allosphingosinicella sp.]|jgi:hypothetical protein|nr:DUF4893 domain-containing protein [Allosphingosinicella sp.]
MRFCALLLIPAAIACAPREIGSAAATPAVANWRNVATSSDRGRLRDWRDAWTRGLAAARASNGAEIGAEGLLLDPDAALTDVAPPPGDYRCRTLKIGARSEGLLDYVAYPAFKCRIEPAGPEGTMGFTKLSGSQRPIGRLFPDRERRMIFLGTNQLGDEKGIMRYGRDTDRDMVALLERIGDRRWRLVFPYPHFESVVDVIELIPSS